MKNIIIASVLLTLLISCGNIVIYDGNDSPVAILDGRLAIDTLQNPTGFKYSSLIDTAVDYSESIVLNNEYVKPHVNKDKVWVFYNSSNFRIVYNRSKKEWGVYENHK